MNYGPIIANAIRTFIQGNKWIAEEWAKDLTEKELHECSLDITRQRMNIEKIMIKDKSKGFDVIKAK